MTQPGSPIRLSIVTPSFNQGRFLRQCIESVLSQGYGDVEYIIIDGGSSDESRTIIEGYASHLAYWCSEPDDGQSDAINKGFARATGELVAWLNADDYYTPGTFERIIAAYRDNPDAPFYFGDGLRVAEDGSTKSNFYPAGFSGFSRPALLLGLNYILQPSTFMNRQALACIGYLDTSLHYGMDSDLWMRLSALGEPHFINAALSASREYAETKTSSGSFGRVEELRQISLKHSGHAMTPGVLCYFLDTLHRFALANPQMFPAEYIDDLRTFWSQSAGLMAAFNAAPDGFPREGGEPTEDKGPVQVRQVISRVIHRLVGRATPGDQK